MTLDDLMPHMEGVTTCQELGRRIVELGVPRGLKFALARGAREALGFDWTDKTVREWLKPVKHTEVQARKEREASRVCKVAWRATEQGKAYRADRYANDPQFAMSVKVRVRLHEALKRYRSATGRRAIKPAQTFDLIGCSVPEFFAHIEAQFADGMSWGNMGKWEFDHIVPLAAFDLSDPDQVRQAMHFSNHQPLWRRDNRAKGSYHAGRRHSYRGFPR